MKVLHGLLLLACLSFIAISCDTGSAETKTPEVTEEKEQPKISENKNTQPGGSKSLAEKQAAQKAASDGHDHSGHNHDDHSGHDHGDGSHGVVVEKTIQTEEAPVDDKNVNYATLAKAICKCGSKYIGKEEPQEGDVFVAESDQQYQDAVDCSMKEKAKITDKAISRQALVRMIKKECHDIPGKLVMSLMIALEKE